MSVFVKIEEMLPKHSEGPVPGVYIVELQSSPYIYIGSTGNLYQREMSHRNQLKRGEHPNTKLQLLYAPENGVHFNIVKRTQSKEEALSLEQELLDQHKDNPYCLNIATNAKAAAAGRILSEATKAKMAQAHIGRTHTDEAKEKMRKPRLGFTHSEEAKQRIGDAQTGRKHSEETKRRMSESQKAVPRKSPTHTVETKEKMRKPRLGVVSEEARKHMSEAQRGRPHSEETKLLISKIRKGTTHSEETKEKMSAWQIGKTHSEETKEKIRQATIQACGISVTINGQTYTSISGAARELGVPWLIAKRLAMKTALTAIPKTELNH